MGRPEYLEESDIIFNRFQVFGSSFSSLSMHSPHHVFGYPNIPIGFQKRDVYGAWEQYLGLEHTDCPPKRSYSAHQVCNNALYEKPSENFR